MLGESSSGRCCLGDEAPLAERRLIRVMGTRTSLLKVGGQGTGPADRPRAGAGVCWGFTRRAVPRWPSRRRAPRATPPRPRAGSAPIARRSGSTSDRRHGGACCRSRSGSCPAPPRDPRWSAAAAVRAAAPVPALTPSSCWWPRRSLPVDSPYLWLHIASCRHLLLHITTDSVGDSLARPR